MESKIVKDVIQQHLGAIGLFKDNYSFKVKQEDILFYLGNSVSKYQAEQIAAQKKVDTLNKKIAKLQPIIDTLNRQIEITKSVTEEDINRARDK